MKITTIGEPKIVMSNPESKWHYFAWPTAARLQNGKIAVVASGFRLRHICPFGKTVISYSEDDGETYTRPAPVIDTVLDDRDGGIVPFGKSGVMLTSFNNSVDFQRKFATAYDSLYLDSISSEEEKDAIGSHFCFSHDGGVTFGKLYKSPITSPHGPVALADDSLLWLGRTYYSDDAQRIGNDCIQAYRVFLDGSMEYVGQIENVSDGAEEPLSCEPHAIALEDGRILVHIRVCSGGDKTMFTIFQSESADCGKTWSTPKQILPRLGGAPPHLFRHSSGTLICTYGYREKPFGIKAMFSTDNGKTWDSNHDIYANNVSRDIGYPSTVELKDGSLLTVFYACPEDPLHAVIMQQKWKLESNQ